jgi:hypothetical protein
VAEIVKVEPDVTEVDEVTGTPMVSGGETAYSSGPLDAVPLTESNTVVEMLRVSARGKVQVTWSVDAPVQPVGSPAHTKAYGAVPREAVTRNSRVWPTSAPGRLGRGVLTVGAGLTTKVNRLDAAVG